MRWGAKPLMRCRAALRTTGFFCSPDPNNAVVPLDPLAPSTAQRLLQGPTRGALPAGWRSRPGRSGGRGCTGTCRPHCLPPRIAAAQHAYGRHSTKTAVAGCWQKWRLGRTQQQLPWTGLSVCRLCVQSSRGTVHGQAQLLAAACARHPALAHACPCAGSRHTPPPSGQRLWSLAAGSPQHPSWAGSKTWPAVEEGQGGRVGRRRTLAERPPSASLRPQHTGLARAFSRCAGGWQGGR